LIDHLNNIDTSLATTFYFEIFPAKKIKHVKYDSNASSGGHHLIPAILFTDTNGNYWYRDPSGKLHNLCYSYTDELVKRGYVLGHVEI
jgi:hypothetical protein